MEHAYEFIDEVRSLELKWTLDVHSNELTN